MAHNITLAMQTAQIAALRHNSELYKVKLEQVSQWLEAFYQPEDDATIGTLKQLQELRLRPVNPQLPKQLQSLQVAKVLSEERLESWLQERERQAIDRIEQPDDTPSDPVENSTPPNQSNDGAEQ